MKKIFLKLILLTFVPLLSCQDEIDVEGLLSFPPAIKEAYPFDGGKVVIGGFDVKIVFADGIGSPLKSANAVLVDEAGNELFSISEDLSGTLDSIVVAGTEFDAASLPAGTYKITVTAEDTKAQSQVFEIDFDIITSLYPANNNEMYIAGEFNGWGADALTLVGAYTWEITNINLAGGKFKFKNTTNWSDEDWGDADCDGIAVITTGGGPDTNCGYSGLVNVKFNDQTLAYTITPAVTYAKNVDKLFLLGNINNFQGSQYAFTHIADNTWELAEVRLKAGDFFKLAESPTFSGSNFGDNEGDGIAEEFGSNIVRAVGTADAFYKITFNDASLEYSIDLVRYPYPDEIYMVGSIVGWDNNAAIKLMKVADGRFEMYYNFAADAEFKFLPQLGSWTGDWGRDPNNAGSLIQDGEQNLAPTNGAGFYRIQLNFIDKTYVLTKINSWGVVGDATPGGWPNDPTVDPSAMTFEAPYTFKIDMTLGTGAYKFRANNGWDVNFGDTGANGSLEYGGDNLASPGAGDYTITITLAPTGYTHTITPQ